VRTEKEGGRATTRAYAYAHADGGGGADAGVLCGLHNPEAFRLQLGHELRLVGHRPVCTRQVSRAVLPCVELALSQAHRCKRSIGHLTHKNKTK
jgi:hypothetical protein